MERRCACHFRQVCRCFFYGFSFLYQKIFSSLLSHIRVTVVTRWRHCCCTLVSLPLHVSATIVTRTCHDLKLYMFLLICNNNPNIIYYANKV